VGCIGQHQRGVLSVSHLGACVSLLNPLCRAVLCCVLSCSMRLLQNTSRGIGDLILIYKRMTGLAGHTSRVSELLEQVGAVCVGGRVAVGENST